MRRINVGRRARRARANWKFLKMRVMRQARTKALLKNWYAPPRMAYDRGQFFRTGGGPGFRLAESRYMRNLNGPYRKRFIK